MPYHLLDVDPDEGELAGSEDVEDVAEDDCALLGVEAVFVDELADEVPEPVDPLDAALIVVGQPEETVG